SPFGRLARQSRLSLSSNSTKFVTKPKELSRTASLGTRRDDRARQAKLRRDAKLLPRCLSSGASGAASAHCTFARPLLENVSWAAGEITRGPSSVTHRPNGQQVKVTDAA